MYLCLNNQNIQLSYPIYGLVKMCASGYVKPGEQLSQDVCHPRIFHHMKFAMNQKLPTRTTPTTDNSHPKITTHAIPTHDNSHQNNSYLELLQLSQWEMFKWELPCNIIKLPQDSFHRTIYRSNFCTDSFSSFQEKQSF